MKRILIFLFLLTHCSAAPKIRNPVVEEVAFDNIRQVTFEAMSTQAHWSFDDKQLIFRRNEKNHCDTIYILDVRYPHKISKSNWNDYTTSLAKESRFQISPSFLPSSDRILLSSPPSLTNCSDTLGDFQIFLLKNDGSDWIPAEPAAPRGYQAEVDVCKNGKAVFTSDRDGDRTLYSADVDGTFGTFSNVTRIDPISGNNDHAHFSSDCSKLVWRHSVARGYEIWMGDSNGTHSRKITYVNEDTSAVFTPDGHHIVFTLNQNLYQINVDGSRLKRITFSEGRESDPAFSHDGKKIVFSSSRGTNNLQTNLFVADWKDLFEEIPFKDSKTENLSEKIPFSERKGLETQGKIKNPPTSKNGYLGAEIDRNSRGSSTLGVKITRLFVDSPASKAGLQLDDRIVGLIGSKAYSVLSVETFDEAMKELKPDEKIKIQIRRGLQLKMIELEVTLDQKH